MKLKIEELVEYDTNIFGKKCNKAVIGYVIYKRSFMGGKRYLWISGGENNIKRWDTEDFRNGIWYRFSCSANTYSTRENAQKMIELINKYPDKFILF